MPTPVRTLLVAAGAAALLSAQIATAAPVPRIDPLVSLSALGTAQSRSAVCAAGASAAIAAGAAAAQAAPAPGCVLPVTGTPVASPVSQAPPPFVEAAAPAGIGTLPLILGLAAIVAAAALLLSDDDDGEGDLIPISPA